MEISATILHGTDFLRIWACAHSGNAMSNLIQQTAQVWSEFVALWNGGNDDDTINQKLKKNIRRGGK